MFEQSDGSVERMGAEIARLKVLNRLEDQFAFALSHMFDERSPAPPGREAPSEMREKIKRHLLSIMTQRVLMPPSSLNCSASDSRNDETIQGIFEASSHCRPA